MQRNITFDVFPIFLPKSQMIYNFQYVLRHQVKLRYWIRAILRFFVSLDSDLNLFQTS